MALGDILGGLGGLAEGYLSGQNKLQQLQYNQYATALKQLALQQAVQKQGAAPAEAATLRGLYGQEQQQPTQAGLPPVQRDQLSQPTPDLPNLPQVPNATAQMGPQSDQLVKGSWFGNSPGWRDPSDSGLQAGGQPVSAGPGIALPSRATLGQMFEVTAPNGRTLTLPQTDKGPAPWTGRGVDINSPAAQAFGYTPQNFPTDQKFEVKLAAANQMVQQQRQAMPPQLQQAGQAGAQTTLRNMTENPLALSGRMAPGRMMKAIDDANPNANDEVKMAVFHNLYPMLSNAGKLDFAEGMQLLRLGQGDERLQTQKELLDLRRDLGLQPKGAPYQPLDAEGKPVGPPGMMEGNRFVPMQGLPPGAGGVSKVGGAGAALGAELKYPDKWEGMPNTPPPGVREDVWDTTLYYARTHQMPALGMQPGMRSQVIQSYPAALHALGIEPSKAPDITAAYAGERHAEIVGGGRAANIEFGIQEAKKAAPQVIETSKAVPRSEFPTFNNFTNWLQEKSGDPNIVAFKGALNTYLNVYASTVSRQGRLTDAQQKHAYDLLSTNHAQGQIERGMEQLNYEMSLMQESVPPAMEQMERLGQPPALQTHPAPALSPQERARGATTPPPDFSKMTTDEVYKWLRDNP